MRILVIGADGFVGGHLLNLLLANKENEMYTTSLPNQLIRTDVTGVKNHFLVDICNKEQVKNVLEKVRPHNIYNLAAQSSVSYSWKEPALTYNVNLIGTTNLLEEVRKLELKTRILLIGSAEEYGNIRKEQIPISEDTPIFPYNPYAISKVAQELTAKIYVQSYGLDIILVRAFNHIGPGQSTNFAIPDFALQIAQIEKGLRDPVIIVGNLSVVRDFTDVRDIVEGYYALMRKGVSEEIYNIGSGNCYTLNEILNNMIALSKLNIKIVVDKEKYRPADIPVLCADIRKITMHTSWKPKIEIEKSLRDILDFWRSQC